MRTRRAAVARPAVAHGHSLMAGQPRRIVTGPFLQRAGIVAFAVALMLGIFWLDLSTQLGTAVGALFSVAVLVIAFTRSPLLIYLAASAACVLVVLGLMFAPSSQTPWSVVGANRVIYFGLAWISALLVVKIERARRTLEERDAKLALLAREDALTGVANRRRFDEQLAIEWRRAIRSKTPLSLLMIDIDHFKRYNDRNGHPAGDRCLARVAQSIHATLHRQADMVARYGGEEFAVLLPDTDGTGAAELAEETRKAVEALALGHSGQSAQGVVTVSIGVATGTPAAGDAVAESLLKAADDALYAAKRGGRNRVALATGRSRVDAVQRSEQA